ncbi:MAG: thioredoxin domain-containing protein [Terracidiphilus sp.]|jgi:protein-disulfide isomerase
MRLSVRLASVAALVAFSLPAMQAAAQQQVPAAPAQEPSAPAAVAPVFPKPDPANFTAATPTKESVNAFLQATWGYDDSRMWEVWAIQKTPVEGFSKVTILVGDKSGKQKPAVAKFFALPDGKHILAGDDIIPFGEHPFAEARAQVKERATGPYRGAAAKDLEIAEFADFQCPHCKEAQANMDKLAVDFPKAHIVFENYPLPQHPAAAGAAAYGVCVAKLGGSDVFFTFAAAVFDGQDGLASADGATLTLNSAVTKAGLDPAKIAACAATPETMAAVDASVKLAQDLVINQTPTLVINGLQVPANAPYETIKQIVEFQTKQDGAAQ